MHPEIEQLISIIKEGGKLTSVQKDIVIRRAKELGCDADDVEFELEELSLSLQRDENPSDVVVPQPANSISKGSISFLKKISEFLPSSSDPVEIAKLKYKGCCFILIGLAAILYFIIILISILL